MSKKMGISYFPSGGAAKNSLNEMNLKLIPAKRVYENGEEVDGYVVTSIDENFKYWKLKEGLSLEIECADGLEENWRKCILLSNGTTEKDALDNFQSNLEVFCKTKSS